MVGFCPPHPRLRLKDGELEHMTSSPARRGLLAALLATAALAACQCGEKTQTAGCSSDQECKDQFHNDRYVRNTKDSPPSCYLPPRQCDTDNDCCPGQF